jgi:hypothetical protein
MAARDLLVRLLFLCTVVSASKFRSVSCLCQYLILSLIIVLLVVFACLLSLLACCLRLRLCLCWSHGCLAVSLFHVYSMCVPVCFHVFFSLFLPAFLPVTRNSNPGFYCLQTLRESTCTPQGCSGAPHMEVPSPGRSTTPNPWPRMAAPALTRHRSRAGAQVAREAPEF